jgi:quercetin dioxygenase-like cupin family protein
MSQVENGVVSPSIASMEKIANALGVTLGEFFAAAALGEVALIVRSRDRLMLSSTWSHGQVEALAPLAGGRFEASVITLDPGGRSGKHPSCPNRDEFAYVMAGKVTLTLGPEDHLLLAGDAVSIRAQELRRWENTGRSPVRILVVAIR